MPALIMIPKATCFFRGKFGGRSRRPDWSSSATTKKAWGRSLSCLAGDAGASGRFSACQTAAMSVPGGAVGTGATCQADGPARKGDELTMGDVILLPALRNGQLCPMCLQHPVLPGRLCWTCEHLMDSVEGCLRREEERERAIPHAK